MYVRFYIDIYLPDLAEAMFRVKLDRSYQWPLYAKKRWPNSIVIAAKIIAMMIRLINQTEAYHCKYTPTHI